MADERSREVDEHIAQVPRQARAGLEELRAPIRASAPDATETISYVIPTFDLAGTHLVHFAGYARHVGFCPGADGIAAFEGELAPYKRAKGLLQFPLDRPLPTDLLRRMVESRVRAVTGTGTDVA